MRIVAVVSLPGLFQSGSLTQEYVVPFGKSFLLVSEIPSSAFG
ncbi:Uncharacterised protein [Chlamydia trachomatis]|nr:Uncharacterised protein [Chlamydia trachomatis]